MHRQHQEHRVAVGEGLGGRGARRAQRVLELGVEVGERVRRRPVLGARRRDHRRRPSPRRRRGRRSPGAATCTSPTNPADRSGSAPGAPGRRSRPRRPRRPRTPDPNLGRSAAGSRWPWRRWRTCGPRTPSTTDWNEPSVSSSFWFCWPLTRNAATIPTTPTARTATRIPGLTRRWNRLADPAVGEPQQHHGDDRRQEHPARDGGRPSRPSSGSELASTSWSTIGSAVDRSSLLGLAQVLRPRPAGPGGCWPAPAPCRRRSRAPRCSAR